MIESWKIVIPALLCLNYLDYLMNSEPLISVAEHAIE
jgi:hypothetical protein